MAVAESYEFRVGRVLGRAFSILGRNFVPFGLVCLLFSAPVGLVYLFIPSTPTATDVGALLGLSTILGFIAQYLVMAAVVYGTVQHLRGNPSSIGEIVSRGFSCIFPVLGVVIVQAVALFLLILALYLPGSFVLGLLGLEILSVLLIVPVIIVVLMWWVAIPVAVVERPGVFASLVRSTGLTKGCRWKLFGLLLIIGVLASLFTFVFAFVLGFIVAAVGAGDSAIGTAIATWIPTAVYYGFIAVLVAVCYYELRVAKEGVDIEEIAAVFD